MASSVRRYLLDTNIVVHLIRGNDTGLEIANYFDLWHPDTELQVSVVTIGELMSLAKESGWGEKQLKVMEKTLNRLVPIDIHRVDVNRPYEDDDGRRKPCGFVLDFVGIFEKLEKALAFDSKDVEGVIEGLDVLKERFKTQMEQGKREYLPLAAGKKGDKAVEAVLEHFRDKERREEFYAYFQELEELHEIISSDPFMRPFLDAWAWPRPRVDAEADGQNRRMPAASVCNERDHAAGTVARHLPEV